MGGISFHRNRYQLTWPLKMSFVIILLKIHICQIIFLVLIISSESILENLFSNFPHKNSIGYLYILLANNNIKKSMELYDSVWPYWYTSLLDRKRKLLENNMVALNIKYIWGGFGRAGYEWKWDCEIFIIA